MDKVLLETLRFLYQQNTICKVSEIRKVVDFHGSNMDFLNHLFHLAIFPKYIIQKQDFLTITPEGKTLFLEEEARLARTAEKEELELNQLREEHFDRPAKKLYERWQFYAAIVGITGVILALLKCT